MDVSSFDEILTLVKLVQIQQADTLTCTEFRCNSEYMLRFLLRPLLQQMFAFGFGSLKSPQNCPKLAQNGPNRLNFQKMSNFGTGICTPPPDPLEE